MSEKSSVLIVAGIVLWLIVMSCPTLARDYTSSELPKCSISLMYNAVPVTTKIIIRFTELMNRSSVEMAFSIRPHVAGTFSWQVVDSSKDEMTYTPSSPLKFGTTYTVRINASIARDLAGNLLDGNGNGKAEGSPADDVVFSFITDSPAYLEYVSGSGQCGRVNSELNNSFVVRVLNSTFQPVECATVRWVISKFPPGAVNHTLSAMSTLTDRNGTAEVKLRLGTKTGNYQVSASCAELMGQMIRFNATAVPGGLAKIVLSPPALAILNGSSQQFEAQTTDEFDNPVTYNLSLSWAVSGGIGNITPMGLFTATKIGVGTVSATNATITGSAEVHVEDATRAKNLVYVSGSNQTGPINSWLREPFVAKVTDRNGTGVANITLSWRVSLTPNSTMHRLSSFLSSTNTTGEGSVQFWLGEKTGIYCVEAVLVGAMGSPVVFMSNATPGPPEYAVIVPDYAEVEVYHSLNLTAHAMDRFDNPVEGLVFNWTLTSTIGGNLSASTGKEITFTAGSHTGNVIISCMNDTLSASANISVIADRTPPIVLSSAPSGSNVSPDTSITCVFSEQMNLSSVERAFSLLGREGIRQGSFSWPNPKTLIFKPSFKLARNTRYTVTLGGNACDLAGNFLDGNRDGNPGDNYSWSFTTLDPIPPNIVKYYPKGTDVETSTNISLWFSKSMNRSSVERAFSLVTGNQTIAGIFSWNQNSTILTFIPNTTLLAGTSYSVRIQAAIAVDSFGIKLDGNGDGVEGDDFTWSFTTRKWVEEDLLSRNLLLVLLIIFVLCALIIIAGFFYRRKKRPAMPVRCPHCGKLNDPGSETCFFCGAKVRLHG